MNLKHNEKCAIQLFKEEVLKLYPEAGFTLFGSKARGDDVDSSDIDMLVVLKRNITTAIETSIFDEGFESGLKYNVVFGIVVEEDSLWTSSVSKATPFYQNVHREGVSI